MKVLITGAAGNLGSFLAKHLMKKDYFLHLMIHEKAPDYKIDEKKVKIFRADLNRPETLKEVCEDVDCIVHFAGILFKADPEKFLPVTNTIYFRNLLDIAIKKQVKKVILCSFPHVEGETSPEKPATGKLDGEPGSVHAKTRLEEEKYLFSATKNTNTTAISLRAGMIYGRGILMIDAARWLAKRWLLGVWKKPTCIHLISTIDFLNATEASISKNVSGIYHLGDEGIITLQEFFDLATKEWGYKKPWRMPKGLIFTAASLCEFHSRLFKVRSPLTKDFIRIGMASYYGDTGSMRKDLLPELQYKNIHEGIHTL